MNLKELGETLKNERERQGLSLDDIFEKTKISRSNIQHIESGSIEDLPHPVYAKGFVKNYADYLGLNGQEYSKIFASNIFQDEEDEEKEVTGSENYFEPDVESSGSSRWTFISVILTLILICVLGWLVYDVFWTSPESEKTKTSVPEKSSQLNVEQQVRRGSKSSELKEGGEKFAGSNQAVNATPENQSGKKKAKAGLGQESINETGTREKDIQNTTLSLNAVSQETDEVNASSVKKNNTVKRELAKRQSADQNKTSEKKNQDNQLHIFAFEACWMEADVDSNNREIFLRPGESVKFRFQDQVRIKLGNAGGVTLKYNEKIYPLDAKSGEVKTLKFPPE